MSSDDSNSGVFQVPVLPHSSQKNKLRIDVPQADNFKLGDPIDLKEGRKPQVADSQVSQLPTPIISISGFTNVIVPPKRLSGTAGSAGSGRAVSEFVPGHYENGTLADTRGVANRNISNPLELQTPKNLVTIPLPPFDFDPDTTDEFIYSPARRTYFVPGVLIGSGSFSTVVKARQVSNNNVVVAIKIISVPTTDLVSITNFKSYITRELSILSHLKHPCVVQLYDYNITMSISRAEIESSYYTMSSSKSLESVPQSNLKKDNSLDKLLDENGLRNSNKQFYILQYCPGGNLFHYLEQCYNDLIYNTLFWFFLTRISAELIAAVSYLHSERVVHRDIKLENILLNEKVGAELLGFDAIHRNTLLITLTDFGLSKRIAYKNQLLTTKCGSQDYISPELLMGLEYDGSLLDSWAVGVVIYAMLEHRLPFDAPPLEFMEASNISPSVIKRRRMRHNTSYRIAMIDWDWHRTLLLLDNRLLSDEVKQLIKNLMNIVELLLVRKEKRKTVTDLLHDANYFWIRELLPASILEFDSAKEEHPNP